MSRSIALILGSGARQLALELGEQASFETPYGAPSSSVATVRVGGRSVRCIARHGEAQNIAPHEVNYRANLWVLHELGVTDCIGVNAVGAIAAGLRPGHLAIPDQLIDYTAGRASSFGGGQGPVVHVDFTQPFDPILCGRIAEAADLSGFSVVRGVYGVTQGPRLETAAEIDRLERDGCAMVGMTAMPEAVLARELGIRYAICAVAVNYAAGREPAGAPIHGQIEQYMAEGMHRVSSLLEPLIRGL